MMIEATMHDSLVAAYQHYDGEWFSVDAWERRTRAASRCVIERLRDHDLERVSRLCATRRDGTLEPQSLLVRPA